MILNSVMRNPRRDCLKVGLSQLTWINTDNTPAFTNQPRSNPTRISNWQPPKSLSSAKTSGKLNNPCPTNHLHHQTNVTISYVPLAII
jgi:hypothetical protein